MRAYVDDDSCRGHGVCAAVCPSVFVITDGGYAEATPTELPTDLHSSVADAVEGCPERAVHLLLHKIFELLKEEQHVDRL